MSDLDGLADALREARAALLNKDLDESGRAATVKVIEGALDFCRICGPEAEILRPATAEDLRAVSQSAVVERKPRDNEELDAALLMSWSGSMG